MSRPKTDKEVKIAEGGFTRRKIKEYLDERGERLTQGQIAEEICSAFKYKPEDSFTQGLVSQWLTGRTRIPDKTLMWLGGRFSFDPKEARPELEDYDINLDTSDHSAVIGRICKALDRDPESVLSGDADRAIAVLVAMFSSDK